MTYATLVRCLVSASLLMGCHGMFGTATFRDAVDGKISMDSRDKAAVVELLRAAGVSHEQFLVGETANEPLARNGIALERGRVVRIVLSSTRLTSTSAFASLSMLREARIGNNHLHELGGLRHLDQLASLHVEHNQLSSLASLAPCAHLATLIASNNQLQSTESLASITGLHEADLRANQLTSVTDLSGMRELRWLNLSSNQLTSVNAIGTPPLLNVVLLDDNQLSDIEALLRISTLSTVNVQRNRVAHVSPAASRFRVLRLEGNPATAPETAPAAAAEPDAPPLTRDELAALELANACSETVDMPCRNQGTGVVCRLQLNELRGVVCARFVADRYYRRIGIRQPEFRPSVTIPLSGNVTAHADSGLARVYFKPLLQMEEMFLAFSSERRSKTGVFSLFSGESRGLVIQSASAVSRGVEIEYAD